jgi:sec-independent protein translocase protein TatA
VTAVAQFSLQLPLDGGMEALPMNTLASLFNLAGPDLLVILLIVLLLFGAKKLPELARGMGQAFKEFNKAKDEFENELNKPQITVQENKDKQEFRPEQKPVA